MSTAWQKVHLFISSTFNDMHAERDYLVKRVFPELQDWCERRKLRLVDIDLRWGVTEQDATHNKNVVKVCLNRIDDCRPFFLCFLGQRRGWVPKRNEISAETFDAFPDLSEAAGAASVTEMEILHALIRPFHQSSPRDASKPSEYYERATHAFFFLRDPSCLSQLPNDPPALREIYTNEWIEDDAERIEHDSALKKWREESIPGSGRPHHTYEASWERAATTPELMIPLQCPSQEPANIDRWRRQWETQGVTVTSTNLDDDPIEAARARAFNNRLSAGRLSAFWCEHTRLSEVIISDLQQAIAARYPDHRELEQQDELQREIDQQEQYLFAASEGFIEREGDFDELNEYVESGSNRMFVLTAPAGMGKSTLLANWVDRYRGRTDRSWNQSIHFRFIGQSDGTTSIYSLLRLLLGEIQEVAQKLDEEIPVEPTKLRNAWPGLLEAIGRRGKTVIVIDALNQLESGLADLTWLPRCLPREVKMIVSFKRGDHLADEVHERFSRDEQVSLSEVKPFQNLDDRRRLVRAYLSQYLKELDSEHLETLINLDGAANPLYLKVVLSELRVFGAFAGLAVKIRSDYGDTPASAFTRVLERLESDPGYSPVLPDQAVPLLFGLLAHARRGLSVGELTSLLIHALRLEDGSAANEAVTDAVHLILRQVRPFLARREGRYDFFFESFKIASEKRYVGPVTEGSAQNRSLQDWHELLADYFAELRTWEFAAFEADSTERRPGRRKVAELPYHLTVGENWSGLEDTLCDLAFIEAKCAAGMTYELASDYRMALQALPEARGRARNNEAEAERVRRYTAELIAYASRAATAAPGAEPPDPLRSVRVSSNEELNARAAQIEANATPLERIRSFAQFIDSEAHHLTRCASRPFFCAQEAYNSSVSGPVAQAARAIIQESGRVVTLLRAPRSLPAFNPFLAGIRTLEGHTESVTTTGITHDGRLAVSGSEDNTLRIWDVQTGRCLRTLRGHSSPVLAMALSLDGRIAVSGGGYPRPLARLRDDVQSDNTIRVWDVHTGECLRELAGHSLSVAALGVSADGRVAISGSFDETARVWDLETGRCVRTLKRVTIDNKVVDTSFGIYHKAISLSVDGCLAIVASSWNAVTIWDLEADRCLRLLQANKDGFTAVSLRNDGRRIATASYDGTLRIWDVESGECLQTLEGHSGSVNAVSLSADGLIAATGGEDQTVRIWDTEGGTCLRVFEGPSGAVKAVSLTADGRFAVSGGNDNTLQVWDVEGRTTRRIGSGHKKEVSALAMSADSRIAVSGSDDGTIRVWEPATGECRRVLEGHSSEVRALAMTSDGTRAFSGSGTYFTRGDQATDNTVRIWDPSTGQCLHVLEAHSGAVNAVKLSADERIALSASDDKTLRVWDAHSGRCLHTLEGHPKRIVDPTQSIDGRVAVLGSEEQLRVWDLQTGSCVRTIDATDSVFAVRLMPDGRGAATVIADGTLRLWDIDTGQSLRVVDCGRLLAQVTLSPDGRYGVVTHEPESYVTKQQAGGGYDAEPETLKVYDLREKRVVTKLVGHAGWISPHKVWVGRRHLVTTSGDRTLRVWDIRSGECVVVAAQSQLLRSIAVRRNRIVAGDAMGNVSSFEINSLVSGPIPANAVRLWRFGEAGSSGSWDQELTALCDWCGTRFVAPAAIIDAIHGITVQAGLSPGQSLCLDLPEEAWDEPRLLSECLNCHQQLGFNPFMVDNRDRYQMR